MRLTEQIVIDRNGFAQVAIKNADGSNTLIKSSWEFIDKEILTGDSNKDAEKLFIDLFHERQNFFVCIFICIFNKVLYCR